MRLIAYITLLSGLGLFGCNDDFAGDAGVTVDGDAGVTVDAMNLEFGVHYPDGDLSGDPAYLLKGTVVTPSTVIAKGEVLTQGDRILCVAESCSDKEQFAKAIVVDTNGIIAPGLIDSHNHTDYNYIQVWNNSKKYQNHNQWQAASAYDEAISDSHSSLKDPDGTDGKGACITDDDCETQKCVSGECESLICEMIKYGEIRALIGGATSIQGTAYRKCANTLIRNVDLPYHGLNGGDSVRTCILGVDTVSDPAALANDLQSGKTTAFIIHLAEGIDETARSEFDDLEDAGLVVPGVSIIHGTALTDVELTKVKEAGIRMIWSPSSNIALYGETNDIEKVWNMGIPLALSPDWAPSGEPDLLGELGFVWDLNQSELGRMWGAKDLVEMVTTKAAAAVSFEEEIGELKEGMRADLMVIEGAHEMPYEAIVTAGLKQVRLVMVAGKALYGDPILMTGLAPNDYCESIDICGVSKTLCVKESENDENKLNQTLTEIENALNNAYPAGILPLAYCD